MLDLRWNNEKMVNIESKCHINAFRSLKDTTFRMENKNSQNKHHIKEFFSFSLNMMIDIYYT